jgi:hypothetical protein
VRAAGDPGHAQYGSLDYSVAPHRFEHVSGTRGPVQAGRGE